jgi:hypothetical protein
MFSSFFEKASSYFDQRFILTFWLPSLLFWVALLILILCWSGGAIPLSLWQQQPLEIQALCIILTLAWITLFARFLSAQIGGFMRFYEGYWKSLPFFRWLASKRESYYTEKLQSLDAGNDQDYERIYFYFPPKTRTPEIMPTRLGNIIKNSEIYPDVRYKINAVLIWPRLYSVLPESLIQNIGAAKAELDMMLVFSILGIAFAIFGGLISIFLLPFYFAPLCIWGGCLISWISYQGAINSALPYAQLIKTAFDLHRSTLLKALGLAEPASLEEEEKRWLAIRQLWYRGAPQDEQNLGYPQRSGAPEEKTIQVKVKFDNQSP